MFCIQCGEELTESQKFCPSCGHPNGEQKKQFPRDVLIRRAHEFAETYDMSLDNAAFSVWNFSKIDEFDPLDKLMLFKRDLVNDLMALLKYDFPREAVEEFVDEIYPILRKILLANLKLWFVKKCEVYINDINDGNNRFTYNLMELANSAIKDVYAISKYLTVINSELQNWEGLQFTKSFLKIAEMFRCENHELYGRQFVQEGELLRLREFSESKQRYDDLMNEINTAIVKYNPELKKEIDQETKINDEKESKLCEKEKKSIITRVLCGIAFPLLLLLQYFLLLEFSFRFNSFSNWVVIIVGAVLYALLLVADIRIRNIPLILILNIIGLLLFYPLCWGISALVTWLSKLFMFILAVGVILMVLFFHGDRTNP